MTEPGVYRTEEHIGCAVSVLNVCGVDHHADQKALDVRQNVTFAAIDFLVRVIAALLKLIYENAPQFVA